MEKLACFSSSLYICLAAIFLGSCNNDGVSELPELKTEIITAITQTSAKSGGSILSDGDADITVKGVCWGSDINPTISKSYTSDGSGDAGFVSTMADLLPDTEYHVRAYATNISGTAYGDDKIFRTLSSASTGQIIADHTIVDRFDDIPLEYINRVKEMWLVYAGESHSAAIRTGLTLLEVADSKYQVNIRESGIPETYTNKYLRASRATWGDVSKSTGWIYSYGEEDWFTSLTAISRTKDGLAYCNTNGYPISVFAFGWCWDDTFGSASVNADPVYGVHWYGSSTGGPEGKRFWGLDAEDFAVTGNSVCMDTYLHATQDYINYCLSNVYNTKVIFTTPPVDTYYKDESGYQAWLKQEHIRTYVKADPSRILFDYSDILCYDDNGTLTTRTWNGHTYPSITVTNLGDGSIGHIGSQGSIRLAKAMWWMLARIAGWNGN